MSKCLISYNGKRGRIAVTADNDLRAVRWALELFKSVEPKVWASGKYLLHVS